MQNERLHKNDDVPVTDVVTLQQVAARQVWPVNDDQVERLTTYRLAFGQATIQLGIVEFRILLFWLAGLTTRSRDDISPRRSVPSEILSKKMRSMSMSPPCSTSWACFTTSSVRALYRLPLQGLRGAINTY